MDDWDVIFIAQKNSSISPWRLREVDTGRADTELAVRWLAEARINDPNFIVFFAKIEM